MGPQYYTSPSHTNSTPLHLWTLCSECVSSRRLNWTRLPISCLHVCIYVCSVAKVMVGKLRAVSFIGYRRDTHSVLNRSTFWHQPVQCASFHLFWNSACRPVNLPSASPTALALLHKHILYVSFQFCTYSVKQLIIIIRLMMINNINNYNNALNNQWIPIFVFFFFFSCTFEQWPLKRLHIERYPNRVERH